MNTLLKREKNFNLICHPWMSVSEGSTSLSLSSLGKRSATRGSSRMIFHNKELKSSGCPTGKGMTVGYETGRSMVEMLGVLAVMGVLSVAGIAGYNSAMNRHRANELINEASKRATMVAMQATQGRNTFSIDEFSATNEKLGFTGVQENPKNPQQFQLKLSGVDEKVCTQMRALVGTNTPVRVIDENCTTITYNKDLSTTIYASDYNTNENFCLSNGFIYCPILKVCIPNTEECLCNEHGIKDESGLCQCEAGYKGNNCEDRFCLTNDDCTNPESDLYAGNDYYCQITGDWQNNTSVITGGSCEIDSGTEYIFTNNTEDESDDVTFLVSNTKMSWWAAQNWCVANSKKGKILQLVSYETVKNLMKCDDGSTDWCKTKITSYWKNEKTLSYYYWTKDEEGTNFVYYFPWGFVASKVTRKYRPIYAICE